MSSSGWSLLESLLIQKPGRYSRARVFRMIDARKSIIDEFFQTMPRTRLGRVECLKLEHHYAALDSRSLSSENGVNLDTEGMFRWVTTGYTRYKENGIHLPGYPPNYLLRDGTTYIYGLVRSEWILVTIEFQAVAGYKNRGAEKATNVSCQESTPQKIVEETGIDPEDIFFFLGSLFYPFAKRRAELAEEASRVARTLEVEDCLMRGSLSDFRGESIYQ